MKRVLACAAALWIAAGMQVHAQVTINDNVQFKIKNVNSGLVLGVLQHNQQAGTNAVQWADDGSQDHLWHFIPMNNGQYQIENMLTHQLLAVSGGVTTNGAQIIQWSDTGTSDHRWTLSNASGGSYLIKNVNSGLLLEVFQAGVLDTSKIDQWGPTGCTCQQWILEFTSNQPYVNPGKVAGSGIFVHDPMMIKDGAGTYWLYGTHNTLAKSTDRVNFTADNPALAPTPSWIQSFEQAGDIWAPDVVFHDNQYYQYYSVPGPPGNTHTAAIGVATASSAKSSNWVDHGIVVQSNEQSAYGAIDSHEFQDAQGTWWLNFGSWNNGINLIKLDSTTGLRNGSTLVNVADRKGEDGNVEGAFIWHANGFYYLFDAANPCCNANSRYRILVGRSTSVTGPYLDRGGLSLLQGGGTILLSTHGNIVGPGGASLMSDGSSTLLIYHYYDANNGGTPTLGINLISFDSSGWPYVH
ncbi:MAG: family 43 glycosylhydrolase [Acidobacteriota bacterium]|nr:family 43 glycosylhydrolase [Acidobacteriota bacterium]